MPSKSITSTPYKLWIERKSNLSNLRSWGSATYVHDSSHKYDKLSVRGKKYIFIRYSKHSTRYVFIGAHVDGGIIEIESRDIICLKHEFSSMEEIDKDYHL